MATPSQGEGRQPWGGEHTCHHFSGIAQELSPALGSGGPSQGTRSPRPTPPSVPVLPLFPRSALEEDAPSTQSWGSGVAGALAGVH